MLARLLFVLSLLIAAVLAATEAPLARDLGNAEPKRRLLSVREEKKLCPDGQEACRKPAGDGHVCIDTKTALDSCGGCVHGRAGEPVKTSASGTVCSIEPGTTPNGVKCEAGKCVIKECREGYFKRDHKGEPTCIYDIYGMHRKQ